MKGAIEIKFKTSKEMEASAIRLAKDRFVQDFGSLPKKSDPEYLNYLRYLDYDRTFVEKVKNKMNLRGRE